MSYDLGNWADLLECELCDGVDRDLPDPELPDGFDDDYGLDDWAPDPDEGGGVLDDLSPPGVPLPGGGEATPSWDHGPGVDLTWTWP